jgi:hypothetical protein
MKTTTERIEALEEKMAEMERDLATVGAIPVNFLRIVLDQLVDDRELTSEYRTRIWRAIEEDVDTLVTASRTVRSAVRYALPIIPNAAQHPRDRKPLLRPILPRDQKRGAPDE